MPDHSSWESTLKTIVDQMMRNNVTELEIKRGDVRLHLRRSAGSAGVPPVPGLPLGERRGEGDTQSLHTIPAPLTGIFYAASNPSAAPYAEPGDWVEEGAVLGLIETMKVFNEILADRAGRVVSILPQQGQLIQAGEPVILLDEKATPDVGAEVTQ